MNDGTQNVDLRPDFHLSEVTYHTSVSNSVTPVTISATAATATVEYVDADGSLLDDADTGTAGHQVNVSVGITAIGILVTAPDGTALIHTINVERDSALFGGWTPTKDVHSLDPVADPYVQDIWSNGTTVWVANKTVDKLHAYTLATRARDKTKDISLHVDNRRALRIWSDKTTIWVTDSNDNKLYAYALSDGTRQDGTGSTTDKEFDLHVDNDSARAIWSNGTHIWVVDDFDDKVYAYALSDGTRQDGTNGTTNREFDLEHGRPEGVWSNGTTMWVADSETGTLHVYTLANGVRYATRDVSLAATNRTAAGIWSDGTTIWVGDAALVLLAYPTAFHRIYSYNLPPYLEGTTTLSALTISPSPAIASFAPDLRPDFAFLTYSYRVAVPNEAELVTVNATPSDSAATVVYQDADGETLADADAGTTGHQVNGAVGRQLLKSWSPMRARRSHTMSSWSGTRPNSTAGRPPGM